jgi:hypothetical protein
MVAAGDMRRFAILQVHATPNSHLTGLLLCCCCLVQHVTEIADSITTAAGSSGDESAGDDSASGDDAVGLIPMPIKVIKTDKLIGCLRTPQVRPEVVLRDGGDNTGRHCMACRCL